MIILAPRMLISMRMEVYQPGAPSQPIDTRTLTWNAVPATVTGNSSRGVEV